MSKVLEVHTHTSKKVFLHQKLKKKKSPLPRIILLLSLELERGNVKERCERREGGGGGEKENDGERGENERSLPKDILVKKPYFAFLTFSAMNNSFL